jgi:FkbM family methyltransferase
VKKLAEIWETDLFGHPYVIYHDNDTVLRMIQRQGSLSSENYNVEEINKIDHKNFIDVGAEFGYFTVIAAQRNLWITAFEPHPIKFTFLRHNISPYEKIEVYNYPIGTGRVFLMEDIVGMAVATQMEGTTAISCTPLSAFEPNDCLIKIDVEGAEWDVVNSIGKFLTYNTYLIERHEEKYHGNDQKWQLLEGYFADFGFVKTQFRHSDGFTSAYKFSL